MPLAAPSSITHQTRRRLAFIDVAYLYIGCVCLCPLRLSNSPAFDWADNAENPFQFSSVHTTNISRLRIVAAAAAPKILEQLCAVTATRTRQRLPAALDTNAGSAIHKSMRNCAVCSSVRSRLCSGRSSGSGSSNSKVMAASGSLIPVAGMLNFVHH